MFTRSATTTGQKGYPRHHSLVHYDDLRAADPSHRLPELCGGIFELATSTPKGSISSRPAIPPLPMDVDGDYWETLGTLWTRHHTNYRHGRCHSADDPQSENTTPTTWTTDESPSYSTTRTTRNAKSRAPRKRASGMTLPIALGPGARCSTSWAPTLKCTTTKSR